MGLKREAWLQLFRHAVSEPYSFLFLNGQKPKGERAFKRFEKQLIVSNEDEEEFIETD